MHGPGTPRPVREGNSTRFHRETGGRGRGKGAGPVPPATPLYLMRDEGTLTPTTHTKARR